MTALRRALGILSVAASVVVPATGRAQNGGALAGGAAYELYSFPDAASGLERLSLLTVPYGVRARVGAVAVSLGGTYASGTVQLPDGRKFELARPTDTEIGLTWDAVRDQLSFSVRALLPTGSDPLDDSQAVVASVIASDLLPFRISNWGAGGGMVVEGTASHRLGAFGAGVHVGYGRHDEFEPLAGNRSVYRAGNQVAARVALDTELGRTVKFSVLGGIVRYGDDTFDKQNLFQSGDRYEGMASLAFALGRRASMIAYGGVLHREHGVVLSPIVPGTPTQGQFVGGYQYRAPLWGGWLSGKLEGRLLRSEDGIGQGTTFMNTNTLEVPVGHVTLMPTLGTRSGFLELSKNQRSPFLGLEAGFGLRIGR